MDAPGFEVLCSLTFHVLWCRFAEHEYLDWDILETRADDGDKLINVLLVSEFDFQIGGHCVRRSPASTCSGMRVLGYMLE